MKNDQAKTPDYEAILNKLSTKRDKEDTIGLEYGEYYLRRLASNPTPSPR